MRPFGVHSGFALCPVEVRSGSALADPNQTPKANRTFGLGPLSVRLGPVGTVVLEKKMLTHDACSRCKTHDDDPCQPITICHLSDSGDLKIITFLCNMPVTAR